MKNADKVLAGNKACNHKCRKCEWKDGFSGVCTLHPLTIEYIEALEQDNAKKMVYCKDCIYCKKIEAVYRFESNKYECTNRDGLPIIPRIDPMDYCSRGEAKNE